MKQCTVIVKKVSALFSKGSSIYVDLLIEISREKYKLRIVDKSSSGLLSLRTPLPYKAVFSGYLTMIEIINYDGRKGMGIT